MGRQWYFCEHSEGVGGREPGYSGEQICLGKEGLGAENSLLPGNTFLDLASHESAKITCGYHSGAQTDHGPWEKKHPHTLTLKMACLNED